MSPALVSLQAYFIHIDRRLTLRYWILISLCTSEWANGGVTAERLKPIKGASLTASVWALLPFNLMPFFAPSLSRTVVHDPLVARRPFDVIRTTELRSTKTKNNHVTLYRCFIITSNIQWMHVFHIEQLLTRLAVHWRSSLSVPECLEGCDSGILCSPPPFRRDHQSQWAAPHVHAGTTSSRLPVGVKAARRCDSQPPQLR